ADLAPTAAPSGATAGLDGRARKGGSRPRVLEPAPASGRRRLRERPPDRYGLGNGPSEFLIRPCASKWTAGSGGGGGRATRPRGSLGPYGAGAGDTRRPSSPASSTAALIRCVPNRPPDTGTQSRQ